MPNDDNNCSIDHMAERIAQLEAEVSESNDRRERMAELVQRMQADRDSMAEELEAAQDKLATIEGRMSESKGELVVLALVELTDPQALALAQFVKRVGWTEWRQNAVDDDEARLMRDAFDQLDKALAIAGYAPR